MREPCDDLLTVLLLLLGVFAFGRSAFTSPESTDVNPNAHVTAASEVGVLGIILRGSAVKLAIRKIFEQGGKFIARLSSLRHIQGCGQPDPVLHWDPRRLHLHLIIWRRWALDSNGNATKNPQPAETAERFEQGGSVQLNADSESFCPALLAAQGAQIDAELFRLLIQVTALQAKCFRRESDVVLAAFDFGQNNLALK